MGALEGCRDHSPSSNAGLLNRKTELLRTGDELSLNPTEEGGWGEESIIPAAGEDATA